MPWAARNKECTSTDMMRFMPKNQNKEKRLQEISYTLPQDESKKLLSDVLIQAQLQTHVNISAKIGVCPTKQSPNDRRHYAGVQRNRQQPARRRRREVLSAIHSFTLSHPSIARGGQKYVF
jgi:hypothetical protein